MNIWLWKDSLGWYWTYSENDAIGRKARYSHGPYRTIGIAKGVARRHWATAPDEPTFVEIVE